MTGVLKLACLVLYALGLAAWSGLWPQGAVTADVAGLVLAAHALEAAAGFRYVRLYRGPLATSIFLTLLFGLLHVLPLARQARHD